MTETNYQKDKQYKQNYFRNYYQINKEKLKQKRDIYSQKKDQIKEYQKRWRNNNRINVIKNRIKVLNEKLAKY